MNFKVGQRVICINDSWSKQIPYPLRKGAVYTISGFYKCDCGSDQVTLEEVPFIINMVCRCNRSFLRRQSYFKWRFSTTESCEKTASVTRENIEPAVTAEPGDTGPNEESLKESSMV